MSIYSDIKEIKVLDNTDEVNELLKDWWELLELYKKEGSIMFVLGRRFYQPIAELRSGYNGEGTD